MTGLRRLVRQQDYHRAGDYYLLVVAGMEPVGREGFMPRKRHYGFLNGAALGSPEATARVAAHELGHGAWHLQHPFQQFPGAQQGATDNLMDYSDGVGVVRYQWGEVHDPVGNFTLFDEGGEGESLGGINSYFSSLTNGGGGVDYILNSVGDVIGTEITGLPDRYFTADYRGSYVIGGKFHIQVNSPGTLRGDIKAGHRENQWDGQSIVIIPLLEIKENVDTNVAKVVARSSEMIKFEAIVEESQEGGAIDFVEYFKDSTIYNIQGIHYNSHEALNFCWGASLSKLAVSVEVAITGAVGYHQWAWSTKPRYRESGPWNERAHSSAIVMGYNLYDKLRYQVGFQRELFAYFVLKIRIESNQQKRETFYRDFMNNNFNWE